MNNIINKFKFSFQSEAEVSYWVNVIKVNMPDGKNIKNIKTPKQKDGKFKVYIDIE